MQYTKQKLDIGHKGTSCITTKCMQNIFIDDFFNNLW
jgi:hypothetical protein